MKLSRTATLLLTTVGVLVGASLASQPSTAGACSCAEPHEVRELPLVSVETNATGESDRWAATAEIYDDFPVVFETASDSYYLDAVSP